MKAFFVQSQITALLIFLLARSVPGGEKPGCAVLTLDALAGVTKEEAALISDRLTAEIWKTDKYTLTARQRIKNISSAQAQGQSNVYSATDSAVELGRVFSVRYVVCGSLGHIGPLHTINTSLVDIETARVITTATTDHREGFESFLTDAVKRNVEQLLGRQKQATVVSSPSANAAIAKPPRIRIKSH